MNLFAKIQRWFRPAPAPKTPTLPRYKAVDAHLLRRVLGTQCSPGFGRLGYVIGPDVTGRLCHISSHYSMDGALAVAAALNRKD